MLAHVNVAVLSEMLAVALFVTLTPNVTVFANAGAVAAANTNASVTVNTVETLFMFSTPYTKWSEGVPLTCMGQKSRILGWG